MLHPRQETAGVAGRLTWTVSPVAVVRLAQQLSAVSMEREPAGIRRLSVHRAGAICGCQKLNGVVVVAHCTLQWYNTIGTGSVCS